MKLHDLIAVCRDSDRGGPTDQAAHILCTREVVQYIALRLETCVNTQAATGEAEEINVVLASCVQDAGPQGSGRASVYVGREKADSQTFTVMSQLARLQLSGLYTIAL